MLDKYKKYAKMNIISLFFIAASFMSVTLAWFAYSGLTDVQTEIGVKAWYIKFDKVGQKMDSNNLVISLDDVYPGMEPKSERVKISNLGDSDAQISYTVLAARLLDENLEQTITDSYELEDKLSHDFPFHININLSKDHAMSGGDESEFVVSISWPLDSGQNDKDSEWGSESYKYMEEQGYHRTEFLHNEELYNYICSMQDIERLKIDVQNAEITIFAVEDAASLYYFSSVEKDISKVSGSTLKLEDNSSIQEKIELELYIPVGVLKELEIEAVNGTISAEKIVADNVTIEIDNASVQIDELIVEDKAELQINAGQMIIGYYEGTNLETECAMGSIMVVCEGSRSDYNFDLECGMGKIQIDEDSYSGIGEDIHMNHGSKKSMKAECAMGEIILEFPNSL